MPAIVMKNVKMNKGIEIGEALLKEHNDSWLADQSSFDMVNQPPHYKEYSVEVIDMMAAIWGPDKVADYCEINAFKYRMRAGKKIDLTEDLEKESWYLEKAKQLRDET